MASDLVKAYNKKSQTTSYSKFAWDKMKVNADGSRGTGWFELKEGEEIVVQIPIPENTEPKKKRIHNLHPNAFEMSDDFDDELPDSFYFGDED